jgi:hypothetical protein
MDRAGQGVDVGVFFDHKGRQTVLTQQVRQRGPGRAITNEGYIEHRIAHAE